MERELYAIPQGLKLSVIMIIIIIIIYLFCEDNILSIGLSNVWSSTQQETVVDNTCSMM